MLTISQRKLLRPVGTFVVAASNSLNKARADYVCDGVDDQVEIQAALDALPDTGGEVALTEGTFNISAPILAYKTSVARRHTALRGRGFGITVIELVDDSNCNMIEYVSGDYDLGFLNLEEMSLHGNKDNQTSGHGFYAINAAGAGTIFDIRLRNVFFVRCKENGFFITGGWGVMIDNCISEYNGGHGGYISGAECYINEFHSALNDGAGIRLKGKELQVSNCRIDSNGQSGLILIGLSNSEITNCYIGNWGTVTANMFAIQMQDTNKVAISNCTIKGVGTTATKYGIWAHTDCANIVVTGCIVENVYIHSIYLNGDDSVVTGCNVEKGVDGSIAITNGGTGNVIEHNFGSDEIATGTYTLQQFGVTTIDSSGGAVTGTLPDGSYIGQIKTIVMTDATTSSTVSVTNHETNDPEVGTFDAVDEVWVLIWTGTEWATLKATCTFS